MPHSFLLPLFCALRFPVLSLPTPSEQGPSAGPQCWTRCTELPHGRAIMPRPSFLILSPSRARVRAASYGVTSRERNHAPSFYPFLDLFPSRARVPGASCGVTSRDCRSPRQRKASPASPSAARTLKWTPPFTSTEQQEAPCCPPKGSCFNPCNPPKQRAARVVPRVHQGRIQGARRLVMVLVLVLVQVLVLVLELVGSLLVGQGMLLRERVSLGQGVRWVPGPVLD